MSIDTSKAIKSISYNGQDMSLSSSGSVEVVSFTIKIRSPVAIGWAIAVINDTGTQVIESKGNYTAYRNSLCLPYSIIADMNLSSGIERVYNSGKQLMGYLITGDAIFYV